MTVKSIFQTHSTWKHQWNKEKKTNTINQKYEKPLWTKATNYVRFLSNYMFLINSRFWVQFDGLTKNLLVI